MAWGCLAGAAEVVDYQRKDEAGERQKIVIDGTDVNTAVKLFEASVQSEATRVKLDIDTHKQEDIKLESLMDMAFCYPEVYPESRPIEALDYFKKHAWSRKAYTLALEKLAGRYVAKKQWNTAAVIYCQLAELRHEPDKLLEYVSRILECRQVMNNYENAEKDVALIVKALKGQKYSIHIAEADKQKDLQDYDRYARDLITHLHDKARQEKSIEGFNRAANAYGHYLEFFSDSPTYKEMAANHAETLFSSNRYLEAAKRYEALADDKTAPAEDRREKLHSTIISYYNALKNKENLNAYEAACARCGLSANGKRFAAEYPTSPHIADVLFNVAWGAYESGKHDEAILKLLELVARYPEAKSTPAAVHFILDAYRFKEKYDARIAYGKKVLADPRIKDPGLKQQVAKIVESTEAHVVSTQSLEAAKDWEKGKKELMEAAKKNQSGTLGELALSSLIVASKEVGDLETLFSAGRSLIDRHPNSSKVKDTLGLLIDSALKMGQFRMMADYLEIFSEKQSRHPKAVEYLDQAGRIRQNLGQYQLANLDFQRLLQQSPQDWEKRPQIVFHMVDNARWLNDGLLSTQILDDHYDSLPAKAKVRADAMRASDCFRKGQADRALAFKRRAGSKYNTAMGKDDPELAARLAEAAYDEAQRLGEKYLALRLESRIDNNRVKRKAVLLGELEKKYQEVIAYQSPAWALKACFQAAEAYAEFVRFLIEVPIPDLAKSEKTQYNLLIEQKAKAYRNKAAQYRQSCVIMAHRWELCEPELVAYYRLKTSDSGQQGRLESFSPAAASIEIASQSLKDQKLRELHVRLLKEPQHVELLRELTQTYLQKGDFRQAAVIAQNTLTMQEYTDPRLKSRLFNLLGLSHLYCQDDARAREDFKQALAIDSANLAARVNLAGLYRHYGHAEKAGKIYATISGSAAVEQNKEMIHPRAGELFYAQARISQR